MNAQRSKTASAKDAYAVAAKETKRLLVQIEGALGIDRVNAKRDTWGHVGSLNACNESLREALSRLES